MACGLNLVCRKQPSATLVELAAHLLPAPYDAILVDHGKRDTSVRDVPESPRVDPPHAHGSRFNYLCERP